MPPSSSRTPGAGTFAAVLRRLRENAGLTQAELADQAGIGVRTVSNLERGINTSPYPSTVRLLADALELGEAARGDLVAAASGRRTEAETTRPVGGFLGALPPAPIVARDRELASIIGALDATEAGQGHVVLLAGEPGIGKTRLAQEAMLHAERRGFLVASGRCFEQQRAVPFAPLLELFGSLDLRAAGVPPIAERWPELVTLLPGEFSAGARTTAWTAPDAAEILHRAATDVVRELAAARPVALLVDDLHWADDATADLLTHLVRHTAGERVLLLGTYRDAEVGSVHPVRSLAHALRRERMTDAIVVRRFDRDTTALLVSQRLDGDAPDEAVDLVHRHAEGNPFFTVEVLTSLVDHGDLVLADGGHWVCRELSAVDAPTSVSEAVGERVRRLAPSTRTLLEAASVLGSVFDADDVPVEDGDDPLEKALDEAVASGLLRIDEDRYAFEHSLTRQALYGGLSPVRRRRLHRSVGERLERRPEVIRRRRSAEIAHHLEAGGLPDRALAFALVAGDVAASAYSQAEAVRLFGLARELAEEIGDDAAVATALERLGHVELLTARFEDATEHFVAASAVYRRLGQLPARLRVEGMIADALHRRGEAETAATRLEQVVAELEERGDPEALGGAALANGLARVLLSLGQHGPGIEATQRATRLARAEGAVGAEAEAGAIAGATLLFLDQPEEATRILERSRSLAAEVDALTVESDATLALQWAVTMQGDLARAQRLGERGIEITRRADNVDMEALHLANLGLTLFYAGDHEAADAALVRGLELARAGSPTLFSGIPPIYLGVLRAGQGDSAGALACYDEAETAPDLETFAFGGYLAARRAEVELAAGDPASALARLEPWLEHEEPTRIHDVMLFVAAAEVLLATGDLDRGEEMVRRALRRAAATANALDGIDAQRLAARCLHLRGRPEEARERWAEALARAVAVPYPDAQARIRAELAASGS